MRPQTIFLFTRKVKCFFLRSEQKTVLDLSVYSVKPHTVSIDQWHINFSKQLKYNQIVNLCQVIMILGTITNQ